MKSNAAIIETSESIGNLIRQGFTEEARKQLQLICQSEKPWRRLYHHYLGKILLIEGNFESGCQILEMTLQEEGSHILIHADLVAGYYLNKQYAKWRLCIEVLTCEFDSCKSNLHPINKARAEIILAKSLELNGQIYESYQIFKRLSKSTDLNFRLKALCNLVRLEAQYPLAEDFSTHYLTLKNFALNHELKDSDLDILHALILAEGEHVQIESALATLQLIPRTQICYFALGYFELLDIWCRKDPNALSSLQEEIGIVQPFTASDEKLLLLLTDSISVDWYLWPSQIPLSQYLRLIRFLMPRLSDIDKEICIAQLQLFLRSLSPESQKIWDEFLQRDGVTIFSKKNLAIKIEDFKGSISLYLNDKIVPLGRQRLLQKFIRTLIESPNGLSCEKMVKEIWGQDFDEFTFERLRQLAIRLNSLGRQYAQRNLINLTKSKICLHEDLKY